MVVIYDTTGEIIATRADDSSIPRGVPYLVTEVPDGKVITAVDVTAEPNTPIFEDVVVPETLPEKVLAVQEQLAMLTDCILEISEAVYA